MVKAFEAACGKAVPYNISPRREGDIAACYAAPDKASTELNWKAEKSLKDMMQDTWCWQSNNPNGYQD